MTIVLFGDSITAGYVHGEGVTQALTKRIAQAFQKYDVLNLGIPGDTSQGGRERVYEQVVNVNPDYVFVFFGANDVAEDKVQTKAIYRQNLQAIVEAIGKEKVILLTGPYTNQKNHAQDRPESRIKDYAQAVESLGNQLSIPVVPIYKRMKQDQAVTAFFQADGLHFSEIGYDFLAKQMIEALERKIGENKEHE